MWLTVYSSLLLQVGAVETDYVIKLLQPKASSTAMHSLRTIDTSSGVASFVEVETSQDIYDTDNISPMRLNAKEYQTHNRQLLYIADDPIRVTSPNDSLFVKRENKLDACDIIKTVISSVNRTVLSDNESDFPQRGNLPDFNGLMNDDNLEQKKKKRQRKFERSISFPNSRTTPSLDKEFLVPSSKNIPQKWTIQSQHNKQNVVDIPPGATLLKSSQISNVQEMCNLSDIKSKWHSTSSIPSTVLGETSRDAEESLDLTVDDCPIKCLELEKDVDDDTEDYWKEFENDHGIPSELPFHDVLVKDDTYVEVNVRSSLVKRLKLDTQDSGVSSCDLENFEADVEANVGRAVKASLDTNSISPLIKQELQCTIQCRRLSRGEPELILEPEQPKKFELSTEEQAKKRARLEQNRQSAIKARKKAHEREDFLEKFINKQRKDQTRLKKELKRLQESKHSLWMTIKDHLNICEKHTIVAKHKNILNALHAIRVISLTSKEQWKKNNKRDSSVNGVSTIEFAATMLFRVRRFWDHFPYFISMYMKDEPGMFMTVKRHITFHVLMP